jgi:hypothetical protein
MYATIPAEEASKIYTAVLAKYSSDVKSQSFTEVPAWNRLTKNRESSSGGKRIEKRIRGGLNTNGKTMQSDADTVTFTDQANLKTAFVDYMAMLAVPVMRSRVMASINSGPEALVSVAQADMAQATDTMTSMLSSQLFGDGSGKTILGLDAISPTTVGTNTYAGIPESTAPYWQPYSETGAGSFAVNGHNGSGDDKLLTAYLNCSDNGAKQPTDIISGVDVFTYYLAKEGQLIRNTSNAEFLKIGQDAVSQMAGEGVPYRNARWTYDNGAPSGITRLLHSGDFTVYEDPNFNFTWTNIGNLGLQILLEGSVLLYRVQMLVDRRNWQGNVSGWSR